MFCCAYCLQCIVLCVLLLLLLLLCLIDSLCFYFYFTKDARQPLPQIRLSVSMSLGAGQIIFLARINATENKVTGLSFYSWNEFSLHREYLVERSTIRIRKLVLSTGCLCYNSGSNAVFLDGRFLLDADRGNLSLPLRCESL